MVQYLFIGGSPRSGTSLLSALIGNVTGVAVAQDVSIIHYLKYAILQEILKANGSSAEPQEICSYAYSAIPKFDLRNTELFYKFINSSVDECLNYKDYMCGSIFRAWIRSFDEYLFQHYNIPDPRKDRGLGLSYLSKLDFPKLLECQTISSAIQEIITSSAKSFRKLSPGGVDLICEKTPENTGSIDIIDTVFSGAGYLYLELVRDPVSVYGSRKQRVPGRDAKDFCNFFELYAESSLPRKFCRSKAVLRYEDMIQSPKDSIDRIFRQFSLNLVCNLDFESGFEPGKYLSYVGFNIDSNRSVDNRKFVSYDEECFIYEALSPFCEKYSYGPYSKI